MSFFPIDRLLELILTAAPRASDVIFGVGMPPMVEVDGHLTACHCDVPGLKSLTPYQIEVIALSLLKDNESAIEEFAKNGAADASYVVPGRTRLRVNVFSQRGVSAIVCRVVPQTPPTIESLGLPEEVGRIAELRGGLVLVVGPTGNGKSSTLAAILDRINSTRSWHVITIEDPIEVLHPHGTCVIHQRELGSDARSFEAALRSALRQAPKVVMVGEMRDLETVETGLRAAETGQLVLSTLHTADAARTIDRLIGLYPPGERDTARFRLSRCFKYVVAQRLVPLPDGGRIAVLEILKSTDRTREYAEKGEMPDGRSLQDAMEDGCGFGMQTFDMEFERLVRNQVIDAETAFEWATEPDRLRLRFSGLGTSADFAADGGRDAAQVRKSGFRGLWGVQRSALPLDGKETE